MNILTPSQIIEKWPSRRILAADIGAKLAAVHKWAQADRIPSDWQALVVKAARLRGYADITPEMMIEAHSRGLTRAAE
jgi:hypothetical protein